MKYLFFQALKTDPISLPDHMCHLLFITCTSDLLLQLKQPGHCPDPSQSLVLPRYSSKDHVLKEGGKALGNPGLGPVEGEDMKSKPGVGHLVSQFDEEGGISCKEGGGEED